MEANELRIGNLMKTQHGYYPITCGEEIEVAALADPIPLTPEILEAAGLAVDNSIWHMPDGGVWEDDEPAYYRTKHDFYFYFNDDKELQLSNGSGGREYKIGKSIQYLHQLQNLYYALTGEELQIDLKA